MRIAEINAVIMPASTFKDKTEPPDQARLADKLGKTAVLWEAVRQNLRNDHGETVQEWKFYGVKTGWLLKTLKRKRNLFFFNPQKNYFILTFVFGDRAAAAVEASDLPEPIKESLGNAPKYAEGRGLSIEVRSADQIPTIRILIRMKTAYRRPIGWR